MRGSSEDVWPVQRIRFALGAILFFTFEVTIGKQLPRPMVYLLLGMGIASMASAIEAMRAYKLQHQVELIQRAVLKGR